jgi:hypothetical protein
MNINELRIGNYVSSNHETESESPSPVEVAAILSNNRVAYKANDNIGQNIECGHDEIKPIPITSDWLINKLGFKDNGGGYFQHTDFNFFLFYVEEDDYYDCYKQVPANDDTGDFKGLQHVHKLQNLFFELFDEELIENN